MVSQNKYIQETAFINQRVILEPAVIENEKQTKGKDFKFIININLIDNTFEVKIPSVYNYPEFDFPYLNIDNKKIVEGKDNDLNIRNSSGDYYIHRSQIDNIKIDKVNMIVMGIENVWGSKLSVMLNPHFTPMESDILINGGSALQIKTIKAIEVTLPNDGNWIFKDKELKQQTIDSKVKYIYNNVFIVPSAIDTWNGNQNIADIYMSNDDNSNIQFDHNIKLDTFKSSAIRNNFTMLSKYNLSKQNSNYMNSKYLETWYLDDYTYYDFDKKSSVFGYSQNAIRGDTIPYNFSGEYKREYRFSINSRSKENSLKVIDDIDKPILSYQNGIVNLDIEYSDEDKSIKNSLSHKNFNAIKNNFDSEELITLDTIMEWLEYEN